MMLILLNKHKFFTKNGELQSVRDVNLTVILSLPFTIIHGHWTHIVKQNCTELFHPRQDIKWLEMLWFKTWVTYLMQILKVVQLWTKL